MTSAHRDFGKAVTHLIQKKHLTREETCENFTIILNNHTSELHQGAFLSALTAKGESEAEIAGCYDAIYDNDTVKINLGIEDLVDNCGTGMDSFKTFNVSTAASIIAASAGIPMARHGARAITSICGTVDISEAIGVDVECPAELVADSIKKSNLGLFNGMSPEIHPQALGRILSGIAFGSTLNISASLANPARPKIGLRGVYKKEMLVPVLHVMKEIGYTKAITLYGITETGDGIDEASISGRTYCAELMPNGKINKYTITPRDLGLSQYPSAKVASSETIALEAIEFLRPFVDSAPSPRSDMIVLNAAFILQLTGKANSLLEGIETSQYLLSSGKALKTIKKWVAAQNRYPEKGIKTLNDLLQNIRKK